MRITEQELAERKDRLIHTAYELFCEHGIDAVTLLQISEKSGIGLTSIYRYFDSKATLVRHTQKILWEEVVEQMRKEDQEWSAPAKNGQQEIAALLLNFKRFYERHSRYLLFACEYKLFLVRNHIKLSRQAYDEILAPIHNVFISALKRGQEDGSITRDKTVENHFFAIWGVMRGFAEQIVVFDEMLEGPNPWEPQFDLVFRYTLEGLKNKDL